MKRVLIILANYSPNPSSVSNCMKPLIRRMSKNFDIDIVTNRISLDISECEKEANTTIYRVDDYRIMNTIYLNELKKIKSSYLLRMLTKLFASILKALYYIRYIMFAKERGTGGWEEKRVLKKVLELDHKYDYDIMISISQPFQSHYIAEKIKYIKGNNVKWVVYEFDPFTFNDDIKCSKRQRKKMYIDEKRILGKCDTICLTPELYEFYNKNHFVKFSDKFKLVPYANLEQIKYDSNNICENFMTDHGINCLYTGRLYDDIRNPKALLNIFSKIDKNIHLYMMTNFSKEKIKKYSLNDYSPNVIPFQNRETALFNTIQADILVNIGNTVEFQVPGKIFEYISTGKPIIHFSKIENDPALKYLEKYPNKLIVNEWEIDKIDYKDMVEKFCKDNINHRLTFEFINDILDQYSGKAAQEKFISIINEM